MTIRMIELQPTPPYFAGKITIRESEHTVLWIGVDWPETDAVRAVRQATEGMDYFPRFGIQIETHGERAPHYYDCWDATDSWDEMLAMVPEGLQIAERMDWLVEQGLSLNDGYHELLQLPALTPEQRATLQGWIRPAEEQR